MPASSMTADVVPATEKRSFATRYRLMRSKWNEEWWSVAMGGPIGNVLNAIIADVSWITPNAITMLGFLAKLAIVPLLLLGDRGADIAAVVLLQVSVICDCMDGSLARYRKASSYMGALLDKVTDAIGYGAIFAAYGYRVFVDTGDVYAIVIAMAIPLSLSIRAYVYWVVSALQKQAGAVQTAGVDRRKDFSNSTLRERAVMYVKSMPRVVEFAESDLFFWLGLAILIGEMHRGVYFLGIATGIWFVGLIAKRILTVLELERNKKKA